MDRKQDESHAQIEISLGVASLQVALKRGGQNPVGQQPVVRAQPFERLTDAGIGLTQSPEIFPDGLLVTTSDALGQPGREVGARDAARRRVRAREAGKIGVTRTGGEGQQVGSR